MDDKPQIYRELALMAQALLEGESDRIANAANLAALIFQRLPGLNWAGFYFVSGPDLVVGPFQGAPACTRIGPGQGVCGAALQQRETLIVDDVHAFPGHIACDPQSRSEIVVPLLDGATAIGVLDLDSPHPARFDADDRRGLETLAGIFLSQPGR